MTNRKFGFLFLIAAVSIALSWPGPQQESWGQTQKYISEIDQEFQIRKVLVGPVVDNTNDIYAKPLAQALIQAIESDRQWTAQPVSSSKGNPEIFDSQPTRVQALLKENQAQGLITLRVSKGPEGISLRMIFYIGASGLPGLFEEVQKIPSFEINEIKRVLLSVFAQMKKRLPFSGQVLSRRQNEVTVNLGSQHGVSEGQEITAIQILRLQRHPKFKFVVQFENSVIGKIKLIKVEQGLSFGVILTEKESGMIEKNTFVVSHDPIEYAEPLVSADGKNIQPYKDPNQSNLILGEHAGKKLGEWIPTSAPQFGRMDILLGLGSYSINNALDIGPAASTTQLVPGIKFLGEMWINPEWFANLSLRQMIFKLTNSYPADSSPSKLAVSTSIMSLRFGYNFLMQDEFFGPKIQLSLGLDRMNSQIDQSSPPAFTSVTYSGISFGVGGTYPIPLENQRSLTFGTQLNYHWKPNLSEAPVTSAGGSSSQISSFLVSGNYQFSQRMSWIAELDFDNYNTQFGSDPGSRANQATSLSHSFTTFFGGLEYRF